MWCGRDFIQIHRDYIDHLAGVAGPYVPQGAYAFAGFNVKETALIHPLFFLTPIMVVGAEKVGVRPIDLVELSDSLFNHIPVKGTQFDPLVFQQVIMELPASGGFSDLQPLIQEYNEILIRRGLRGAGIDAPPHNLATASPDEMPHHKWTPWRGLVWCFNRL